MSEKNSEKLRDEYNHAYSQPIDTWSTCDLNQAQKIVRNVVNHVVPNNLCTCSGKRLLDVGCAKGYITEAFRLTGFESHGLDYSDVAIEKAKQLFPSCHFRHMDGFDPKYNISFDLIFAAGFSGANTHNLEFVAEFSNKYISLLNPDGLFILGFSSDFSGTEAKGETVNWSIDEISKFDQKLLATKVGIFFQYKSVHALIKRFIGILLGKKNKRYYFLVYQKTKQ